MKNNFQILYFFKVKSFKNISFKNEIDRKHLNLNQKTNKL